MTRIGSLVCRRAVDTLSRVQVAQAEMTRHPLACESASEISTCCNKSSAVALEQCVKGPYVSPNMGDDVNNQTAIRLYYADASVPPDGDSSYHARGVNRKSTTLPISSVGTVVYAGPMGQQTPPQRRIDERKIALTVYAWRWITGERAKLEDGGQRSFAEIAQDLGVSKEAAVNLFHHARGVGDKVEAGLARLLHSGSRDALNRAAIADMRRYGVPPEIQAKLGVDAGGGRVDTSPEVRIALLEQLLRIARFEVIQLVDIVTRLESYARGPLPVDLHSAVETVKRKNVVADAANAEANIARLLPTRAASATARPKPKRGPGKTKG